MGGTASGGGRSRGAPIERKRAGAERAGRARVEWFDGKGHGILRRVGSEPDGHRGRDQEGVLRQGAVPARPSAPHLLPCVSEMVSPLISVVAARVAGEAGPSGQEPQ